MQAVCGARSNNRATARVNCISSIHIVEHGMIDGLFYEMYPRYVELYIISENKFKIKPISTPLGRYTFKS